MVDLLTLLGPHMEVRRPLFSEERVCRWPAGFLDQLQAAGIVRQAENACRVVCPACYDGHIEEVVTIERPGGPCQFFVYCPEVLRAEVAPESLRQWTIDFEALASGLAAALALHGSPVPLLPGRLWRLGRTAWQGSLRDVLFARGLAWEDAATVARRIGRSRRPVLLVPHRPPARRIWKRCRAAIVPLAEVASWEQGKLTVDAVIMAAIVADADAAWLERAGPQLDPRQLRRLIRAERATALSDNILVSAYTQQGSYRKAAEALIAQGVETDRWAVERAVRRAGGPAAVGRSESSGSVIRAVVSHRRDGRKIFPKSSQVQTGEPVT